MIEHFTVAESQQNMDHVVWNMSVFGMFATNQNVFCSLKALFANLFETLCHD